MCCQELLLQPEFFRVHVVQTYCKRPRNKIRSRTAGFAEELWQPMKSLGENEHMVRCEIQISASLKISASKKHIFSFPTKKNTQIKFQVNIRTWCPALTVYFIKCLLKARKSKKRHCQLYTRDFFGKILLKLASEKCQSLLQNGFN